MLTLVNPEQRVPAKPDQADQGAGRGRAQRTLAIVRACGTPGFSLSAGFAANGYGAHSPGDYSLRSCLLCEVTMTLMFLFVIMGTTDPRVPSGFAPIPIGLVLTLIHLISIPVTNTSVNPARSTGPALFVGGCAPRELWLFWLAPIVGGARGGILYRWLASEVEAAVMAETAASAHMVS